MPLSIPYMEMMITRACSMKCDGCANYSNYGVNKTNVSIEDATAWLEQWSQRVTPRAFRILGGEPTLHKDVCAFIRLVHRVWPDATRSVVTNGLHLHQNPELPVCLRETGTKLHFSFHSNDGAYLETIRKPLALVIQWANEQGVRCEFGDYRVFRKHYRGIGSHMRPYDDKNPAKSWEVCDSRMCKNLGYGRMWKCPEAMDLKSTLEGLGIAGAEAWQPYVNYAGIGLDATDAELEDFFAAKHDDICAMCPSNPVSYYKDVTNKRFTSNTAERMQWVGEPIDVVKFVRGVVEEVYPPAPDGSANPAARPVDVVAAEFGSD